MDYLRESDDLNEMEYDDVLYTSFFSLGDSDDNDDDEMSSLPEDYFRKISDL